MNPIYLVITVLIGVVLLGALIGNIADKTIGINQTTTNITGATYTINALLPLIFIIGVIIAVLSAVGIKVAGRF